MDQIDSNNSNPRPLFDRFFLIWIIVTGVTGLTLLAGLIYVAHHFITKVW